MSAYYNKRKTTYRQRAKTYGPEIFLHLLAFEDFQTPLVLAGTMNDFLHGKARHRQTKRTAEKPILDAHGARDGIHFRNEHSGTSLPHSIFRELLFLLTPLDVISLLYIICFIYLALFYFQVYMFKLFLNRSINYYQLYFVFNHNMKIELKQ